MSFTINVDDIVDTPLNSVESLLSNANKVALADLKLFDLLLQKPEGPALRHGVYLFFDDKNTCVYVGMCSSSHFAHRIGGHFGMSPRYRMNTFLKSAVNDLIRSKDLVRSNNIKEKDDYQSYVKALSKISQYQLLIINANGKGTKCIKGIERLLHIMLRPAYNYQEGYPKTFKLPKGVDTDSLGFMEGVQLVAR